jgi:serine O-acetyltransferase
VSAEQRRPAQIRDRADYRAFLTADLLAHDVPRWHFYLRPRYPELHFQRLLRYVEYTQSKRTLSFRARYVVARVRLARLAVHTGISIPPGSFGPGLSIAHVGSIVVHDRARIGSFCRIHSSTNIGVHQGGVPRIGDRVYIAPGAVIYGAVSIGDDVMIGANSVVNSDVPSGVTVAGAPARIIAHQGSQASMPEWFPRADAVESPARSARDRRR